MRKHPQTATKHLFVSGGVVSSLGKGLTASSLGQLLTARGLQVTMQSAQRDAEEAGSRVMRAIDIAAGRVSDGWAENLLG